MSSTTETSWVNGSLADAAEMLAKRATVTRKLTTMKKESIDFSSIGDTISGNPMLQKALIGAGVGAGIGGVSSMFSPKEKRKPFSSILTGALAGGGLGVGAHYLGKALPSISDPSTSFSHNGTTYALDPKALAANPAAMQELNELMQKTPGEGVAGAIEGAVGDYSGRHPLLASILGADVATQTAGTLGGLSSTGSQFRISQRPDALARGFNLLSTVKQEGLSKDLSSNLKYTLDEVQNVLGDSKATKKLLADAQRTLALGSDTFEMQHDVARQVKNIVDKGQGTVRRGGLESIRDLFRGEATAGRQLSTDMLKGTGVPGSELIGSSGKIPFTDIDLPKWLGGNKARSMTATSPTSLKGIIQNVRDKKYGLAGRQVASPIARTLSTAGNPFRAMGRFGRMAPRAALYGGIPLLQAYAGAARAPGQREKRIMELVRSLSK